MAKLINSFYEDFESMTTTLGRNWLGGQNNWRLDPLNIGDGGSAIQITNFPLTPRGGSIQIHNKVADIRMPSSGFEQFLHRVDNRSEDYKASFRVQLTADAQAKSTNKLTYIAGCSDTGNSWLWAIGIAIDDVQIYDNVGAHWTAFVPGSGNEDLYEVIVQSGVIDFKINGVSKGTFAVEASVPDKALNFIGIGNDAAGAVVGDTVAYVDAISVDRYVANSGNIAKIFAGR